MKKSTIITSAILALIFAFGLSFCKPKPPVDEPAVEEAQPLPDKSDQVKAILGELKNAWETGNKKKLAQSFTKEYKAKKWCNNAPGCKGNKKAKAAFRKVSQNAAKKAKKIAKLDELIGSLQKAPMENDMINAEFADGTKFVLKKVQDKWLIEDTIAPAAAPEVSPAEGQ